MKTGFYCCMLLVAGLSAPAWAQGTPPVPDEGQLRADPVVAEPTSRNEPYTYVERMPALNGKGGIPAIKAAVQQRVKYPAAARRDSIEGEVVVTFIVETDGTVAGRKIVRGLGGGCDEAVLAAVGSLPRFQPGLQNGHAVRVRLTLPVAFVLDPVNHPLKLASTVPNGRLLRAATGKVVVFNSYDESGANGMIHAPGLNFGLYFGNTPVESGDRAGAFMLGGKVVQLVVDRLPTAADSSAEKILANHIQPLIRRMISSAVPPVPTAEAVPLATGQPAILWTYALPDRPDGRICLLSLVHQGFVLTFRAWELTGQPPVRNLLLETARMLKFSRKPLFVELLDK